MAVPGLFWLEGNWSNSLKDRSSVRSLLATLEDLGHVRFVHREVATLPEFVKVPAEDVDTFREATKAKAVCGYRRDVDWLESAAFELLLIHALTQDHRRIDARFNELRRTYPDLVRRLKFDSSPAFGRGA